MGVYISFLNTKKKRSMTIFFFFNTRYFLPFNRISSDEKERLRRLKEMKTKQVEMEAMREAELKLKRKVCSSCIVKNALDFLIFFYVQICI